MRDGRDPQRDRKVQAVALIIAAAGGGSSQSKEECYAVMERGARSVKRLMRTCLSPGRVRDQEVGTQAKVGSSQVSSGL